jgi:uncharacterized protein
MAMLAWRRVGAAVGIVAALFVGCRETPAPRQAGPVTVSLASGTPGGGFFPLGDALEHFTATHPLVRVRHQATGGAVANLAAIKNRTADIGIAFADVAYLSYIGRLDESAPFEQLRAIAVLQLTPVQLVARSGSGIRSVADLRGKRVALGPVGSGTSLTARLILDAFGIDATSVRTELLEFRNAGAQLIEGTLDAMFDNAFKADSTASVLRAGGRLVPIEGPHVDRLRIEYPFLRMTVVPTGTYPGTPMTPTIGVDSLLLCRRDLDADVVHAFTAALFEAMPTLSTARGAFAEFDEAPTAPIPLHDGASRFYREQELLK